MPDEQPETFSPIENLRDFPRVRIYNFKSRYVDELGYITGSTAHGYFIVIVDIEGQPRIMLKPEHVNPC